MSENDAAIAAFLLARYGPATRLIAAHPREGGEQGYSGATLRYYDVDYLHVGETRQTALVIKDAPLAERLTLTWLDQRGLPVPASHSAELTTQALAPICMECVGDPPPATGRAVPVARALAAVHYAALGRRRELPWLPPADTTFFAERLIGSCWRGPWRHLASGEGYTNWYGEWQSPTEADPEFEEAFGAVYPRLETVAARFLREMTALWKAGDTLTLVHCDFHGHNLGWRGARPRLLDWGQAHYGPLSIDLPNYFSREEALHYRDALAELGHAIPREQFLAGYDAARPYVGFKYFGIGLTNWRRGDPARRHAAVQYWIDLALGNPEGAEGK